jgi:ubiquitin
LSMQTPADDAAWLARYRATTEQLKSTGSSVQAGGSVEEAVGAEEAARQPELVEAAPNATGLGRSRGDGHEPGLTVRTLETVEATEAATSAHDAGQADVEGTRNEGKAP